MGKYIVYLILTLIGNAISVFGQFKDNNNEINLSGKWAFQIDSADNGVNDKWFSKRLNDAITLPGSMLTNGKGNDVTLNTQWTGSIWDSLWFRSPVFEKYRQPNNIKVAFWLQPEKHYVGVAWYQKTVNIPSSWKGKYIEFFIERSHWETTVWVDDKEIGMQNSLGVPHHFDLSKKLSPGVHIITVRVDNRVKDINFGENSHSISDHTQTNWNGMIGKIFIAARPAVYLDDIQLYPDLKNKQLVARIKINNNLKGGINSGNIQLHASTANPGAEKLKFIKKEIKIQGDSAEVEIIYPMGKHPLLWDEFYPNLYSLIVRLVTKSGTDEKIVSFGMREFLTEGTQFTINGHFTFLRGTLECAIFPKTGFPPTDIASWMRIFKICRSYGLNHMRFHSWTPPEAAFTAADRSGFYLQIENSSWANQGATIGDGKPLDQYIYDESNRVVKAFGNHPSFCMMAYGNEPAGKNIKNYLTGFVNYWKKKDSRRLYTTGAGWPVIDESDFNSTSDPRIQRWGEGLKSIINSQPPKSDYNWAKIIANWQHPAISHEIGQWCVYPDFKEIKEYTGILKPKNFEIFQDILTGNGMAQLADSFLLASGKLQALCYKADIEAALRTPGFGGFQLLDLHDFPGQGTALVGVLNPFWENKGYITGKEYSRFCNAVVPLALLPKMIYLNNEVLSVPIEVAQFSGFPIKNVTPIWTVKNASGQFLFQGQLPKVNIPLGSAIKLGAINQSLSTIRKASRLILSVALAGYENSWEIFVYPASLPKTANEALVTQQLDENAIQTLNNGGKVLLTLKEGSVKPDKGGDVQIGFSSIFWNTSWTQDQPPTTLGILCDPAHPAFKDFPTQYYSNWQWWDAMSHSNAIRLDAVDKNIQPIVRVIDDWYTAKPLALLFECKVGTGKLLLSGIDLISDADKRPEAKQLLHSLKMYMASSAFNPAINVEISKISGLINN